MHSRVLVEPERRQRVLLSEDNSMYNHKKGSESSPLNRVAEVGSCAV